VAARHINQESLELAVCRGALNRLSSWTWLTISSVPVYCLLVQYESAPFASRLASQPVGADRPSHYHERAGSLHPKPGNTYAKTANLAQLASPSRRVGSIPPEPRHPYKCRLQICTQATWHPLFLVCQRGRGKRHVAARHSPQGALRGADRHRFLCTLETRILG
jgi:hypothetical protein